MTQDHVETLNKARQQLAAQRRLVAETLALGFKRGATLGHLEEIVRLQAAIKAIDEAIEDERALSQIERQPIEIEGPRARDDDEPDDGPAPSILTL